MTGVDRLEMPSKMMRKPEIIVAEVGDELTAGLPEPFVVRS